ncbi:MAG: YncE family protein, partial [Chitinophagaceae bacterium]
MKKFLILLASCIASVTFGQSLRQIEQSRVKLPNGWSLTPVGKSLQLGDLPLNMAVSKSGRYLAVTNNGQSVQSIQLFDVKSQKQLDAVTIPKSWYGLAFSANEKYLYASGGNDNVVWRYSVVNNKLQLSDSLELGKRWPNKISPTGLAIDDKANLLYVVTKDNNTLYVFDLQSKAIAARYKLPGEAYSCLLSPTK